MQSTSNGLGSAVSLVVLLVIVVLVRRGRVTSSQSSLAKGERVRPLAITLLDPLVSLVIIGPIFWHLASTNIAHVAYAALGAVLGIGIGWARARVMFVRALRASKNVVLRRSGVEYGLLALLIILRLIESSVKNDRIGFQSYALTVLISLAVVESIARSAFIVIRYLSDKGDTTHIPPLQPDAPSPG
jgi:hypothetical protein